MYLWSNGGGRVSRARSGSGSGALPAVAARLTAFWRNRRGIRENCCSAVSDPLGVLMNGGLQFGEDRPCLLRAARGESLHAELSDAIIQATRAQVHGNEPSWRRRAQLIHITLPDVFIYRESRTDQTKFRCYTESIPEGQHFLLTISQRAWQVLGDRLG